MSSPSAHPSAFGTSSLGDARVRGREAHGLCGTGRVPGHHHPLPLYNLLERPRQAPGWKPAERPPDTKMIQFAACDRGGPSQQAAAGGPGLVRRVSAAIPRPQPALFCCSHWISFGELSGLSLVGAEVPRAPRAAAGPHSSAGWDRSAARTALPRACEHLVIPPPSLTVLQRNSLLWKFLLGLDLQG